MVVVSNCFLRSVLFNLKVFKKISFAFGKSHMLSIALCDTLDGSSLRFVSVIMEESK